MTSSRKNQSALRAALKKEDEAVAERLPAVAEAPATGASAVEPEKVAPPPADAIAKPRRARAAAAKPAVSAAKPAAAKPAASGMRGEEVLPPLPNVPPIPAPTVIRAETARPMQAKAPDEAAGSDKRGKVVHDTFAMPKGEHGRIKTLRATLAGRGRQTSKSELLRVGLRLVAQCSERELLALLDALPAVNKGKRRKKS
ncbi:MAG: hypothetical protein EYC67_12205 [Betaproteobacteria bacterium]|nr:MAG: hypothetical protein EYC67_12205 [Betaproteobacteria bacterium]